MTVLRCHATSNEHDRQIEPFCSSIYDRSSQQFFLLFISTLSFYNSFFVSRSRSRSLSFFPFVLFFSSLFFFFLLSFLFLSCLRSYVPSENAIPLIPVIVSAMRWSWTSYVIFIYIYIYILSIYIIYIHITYFDIVTWCWTAVLFDWHSSWCRIGQLLFIIILFSGVLERSYKARIMSAATSLDNGSPSSFLRGSELQAASPDGPLDLSMIHINPLQPKVRSPPNRFLRVWEKFRDDENAHGAKVIFTLVLFDRWNNLRANRFWIKKVCVR